MNLECSQVGGERELALPCSAMSRAGWAGLLGLLMACGQGLTIAQPNIDGGDAAEASEASVDPPTGSDAGLTEASCARFGSYYVDRDRDGFGAGEQLQLCEPAGPGYSTVNGDCDDSDPRAFPGQTTPQPQIDGGTTDFNCNTETVLESTAARTCAGSDGCAFGTSRDFWQTRAPACGEMGTWVVRCDLVGSDPRRCGATTEQRIQRCL